MDPIKLIINLPKVSKYMSVEKQIQNWIGKPMRDEKSREIGKINLVWLDGDELMADVTIDPVYYNQHFAEYIADCVRDFSTEGR